MSVLDNAVVVANDNVGTDIWLMLKFLCITNLIIMFSMVSQLALGLYFLFKYSIRSKYLL